MAEAFAKTFKRDYVRVKRAPECRGGTRSDRSLDGGPQHRAPAFAAGLPLTAGVYQRLFATRRVFGLAGSTPPRAIKG
jgi:hypothetical protein